MRSFLSGKVTRSNLSPVACVASVPVRGEQNSGHPKQFIAFGSHEKWGESKKVEERGWGKGIKKGSLARKPPDFEKPVRPRTELLIGAVCSS